MRALGPAALLAFALLASSLGAAAGPVETVHHWRNLVSRAAVHQYEGARDAVGDLSPPDLPPPQDVLDDAPGTAGRAKEDAEAAVEALPPPPALPGLPPLPAAPSADDALAKALAAQEYWRGWAWRVYQRYT